MKLFLDDRRLTPEGWQRAYWPDEAIHYLETGAVRIIGLDYDLGDDTRGTGLDVLVWIEEAAWRHAALPRPKSASTTSDPDARAHMNRLAAKISRMAARHRPGSPDEIQS